MKDGSVTPQQGLEAGRARSISGQPDLIPIVSCRGFTPQHPSGEGHAIMSQSSGNAVTAHLNLKHPEH